MLPHVLKKIFIKFFDIDVSFLLIWNFKAFEHG